MVSSNNRIPFFIDHNNLDVDDMDVKIQNN